MHKLKGGGEEKDVGEEVETRKGKAGRSKEEIGKALAGIEDEKESTFENDEWDTGTEKETATACSFCGDNGASIVIKDNVLSVIYRLCEIIKEEWQILLIGTDDGMTVRVTDYYVPEQEYGSAHVHQKECVTAKMIAEMHIIAGIHSHSTFEPYFSATDEITNNSLIRTHIVVNNKHKFVAKKRVDLPCGMKKFVTATVVRDLPALPKIKKVKGIKKIEKTKYQVTKFDGFKGGYPTPVYPPQTPMGYGTLDALPGLRKRHAFGEVN